MTHQAEPVARAKTGALARLRVWPTGAVLAALTIAVAATVWPGAAADSVGEPADTTAPQVESAAVRDDPAAFRLVPPSSASPAVTAEPVLVADPTAGDLRVDAEADVLPVDYEPPAPTTTTLDIAYGADPAQRLDLHLPATSGAPVVLYLHSGGWIGGDKAAVPEMVLRFVERGYAVASVGYRLAPDHTFPAPVTDVNLAIRWLKAHGEQTGTIDGHRLVLFGASAGGHLAAYAAATQGELEPANLPPELAVFDSTAAGVVSAVGPTDLVSLYDHPHMWARGITSAFVGCDPCDAQELATASVGGRLHPDLPPAYWAYGTEDPLVDSQSQGAVIAEAWAAHAGPDSSWLDLVDGGDHTLDQSIVNQRALEAFVDRAVGVSDPAQDPGCPARRRRES